MTQAKLSRVGGKSVICLSLIFLLSMLLMVCTRQTKSVPSDLEEYARLRRSLSDNDTLSNNDTLFSDLPCTQPLAPVNGTVQAILSRLNVTNNYVSLVRLSINFTDENLPEEAEQSNPTIWQWGLGGRGRTLLHFPYDNSSLSLTTLHFGVHSVEITLDNRGAPNDSYSDLCFGYSLYKLLWQVRMKMNNPAFAENTIDVICRENYLNLPSFRGTLIPGYSLFDLQASTYFECWNIVNKMTCNQANCIEYPSFDIYCTLVTAAFWTTYILLFLALIFELWRIYSQAYNYQDVDIGETVNILRIHLIPPILLMLASNKKRHHRIFNITYWAVIFAIPFIIYFSAFLWYVTKLGEYAHRSSKRGGMFTQTNAWGLDFGLANIMYIDGTIVFLYFLYKYRLKYPDHFHEKKNNWKSKEGRMCYFTLVAVLCFFRLSATVMLLVEILALTVIGIAINIRYGSPIWVNVILGVFVMAANIVQFFDSYQFLFNNIQSVGSKVDRDVDSENKIFEQTPDGSPQLEFNIKSSLLRDIIKKWLPLHIHLFRTMMHIVIAFAFLAVIAVVVVFIDRTTEVSSFVEYVITGVPLVIAAAGKLAGSSLTAGGRAKNKAKDRLLILEGDLREYALTGVFPARDDSCWESFWAWTCYSLGCTTEHPNQQDSDQGPEENQGSPAPTGSINQPTDPPEGSATDRTTPPTAVKDVSTPVDLGVAGDRTSAAASSLSSPTAQDPEPSSAPLTEPDVQTRLLDGTEEKTGRNNEASV